MISVRLARLHNSPGLTQKNQFTLTCKYGTAGKSIRYYVQLQTIVHFCLHTSYILPTLFPRPPTGGTGYYFWLGL